MRQVYENTESTDRQYAFKERLIDLGWSPDQIQIIDQDLGKSGADSKNRVGFQTLIADVANGIIGAIACIECSRLSRDSEDWSKLTRICALTNTLLIDTDGIYDPNRVNDSLLLGLKGTMSEFESHVIRERMQGGLMNKAERGELMIPVPIGYIYDDGQAVKDPDIEIQKAVELLFEIFRRKGSAFGIIEHYNSNNLKFPRKSGKFNEGDVEWVDLNYHTILYTLHNPIYAGVYCYGRTQRVWTPEGKKNKKMPREDWHVFIKDHHTRYISFEDFEANEQCLTENLPDTKLKKEKTPAREGPALLQGLVYCGKCGKPMVISYVYKRDQLIPNYMCNGDSRKTHGKICQSIVGYKIDKKISELIVSRLTPSAIDQAVCVQRELDSRQSETLSIFKMAVGRCEYKADAARKRYMSVDPDNRLVATQLEVSWNNALKDLDKAINEYEYQVDTVEKIRRERNFKLMENLSESFSQTFLSNDVSFKDKKRMIRYLIEDVTLLKTELKILIQIRFRGDTTQVIAIDAPVPASKLWNTNPDVVKFIDTAAENYYDTEIADMLNKEGYKSGKGFAFSKKIVRSLMRRYSIPNMKKRYINRGYISSSEKAALLGISRVYLQVLIKSGKYKGEYVCVNSNNDLLFPSKQ
jgi:DNA invertase Pin-like site-specific DNA recombinase